MKYIIIITQLCVCISFLSFGQPATGIEANEEIYQEAVNHYEAGHYNLARTLFEKYISNDEGANLGDASYYRAVSAIKLFHNDGEFLLESFISDFPLHSKSSTARFTIGEYYFSNANYTKAIASFEKTKPTTSIVCDLYFKLGYSYLSKRQFEEAKQNFAKVTGTSCRHYLASNYYLGYLYYQDDELAPALKALTNASEDAGFGKSAALMIGNIYFRNDNYREAISFIRGLSPEILNKNPDLYFIRAGAHFELKEYNEAIKNYEAGLERTRNRASSDVFFNLAESYRASDQKQKAIDNYKLSALDETETGAYSSYYLGKLYIETDNKNYARSAFSEALKSEKEEIREEALYQLAKLEYDLGNFGESIRQLKRYNEEYPSGKYRTDVSEYITRSFLNTSDYDIAIDYIESLNSLSQNLKSTYQQVTFLKGADLFNNRKFSSSVKYFDKSLKYKVSSDRTISAHFWKGEAYSIGKLYEEAISSFKSALYTTPSTDEGRLLHIRARYGLGYAYYNSKDYPNALANFKSYLLKIPAGADDRIFYVEDARLRLADCYYGTQEYT
ncbi:MAG: tetratricopeptide repeat protein, partial [Cyclobacteriaceae bacterium]